MEIAASQGRSPDEAQEATPSSLVPLYAAYFEHKAKERTATHYYLALIAAEVRRTRAKHPRRVRLQDMLLKFSSPREGRRKSPVDSKTAWMAALGMTRDGAPIQGFQMPRRRPPPRPAAAQQRRTPP